MRLAIESATGARKGKQMALSENERRSFLERMGAVTEARLESAGIQEMDDSEPEKVWSDAEIQMAIEMGF